MRPAPAPGAFLERYGEQIVARRVRIGCSFAPEQFASTSLDDGAFALVALRAAVEDYGMSDVRLGLRWNRLARHGGELTSYYDAILDYCFASPGVRALCIDLGPIKTFRWPEVHVPDAVLDALERVPPQHSVIEPDSELAQASFDHFRTALRYVADRCDETTAISFCFNEAFHSFGRFGWTMSDDYVATLIDIVEESGAFPGCGFVINSAGGQQLDRIADFFARQCRRRPALAGRLTSGFDLYPYLPPLSSVPVLREALGLAREGWRRTHMPTRRSIRRAHTGEARYRIEVTEAQAEPWGVEQTVGNSLEQFERVLAESIDRILNPQQDTSVIRMWGVEYQLERLLTNRGVAANRDIMELTRTINGLTAAAR